MRGIGKGQTIELMVPGEVEAMMTANLRALDRDVRE